MRSITRESVLSAIEECDRIGRDAFLRKHGFRRSTNYLLLHDGREYDSKAIVGVAHGRVSPERYVLRHDDFVGGENTVERRLLALGFEIRRLKNAPVPAWSADALVLALDLYLREGSLVARDPRVLALSKDLIRLAASKGQKYKHASETCGGVTGTLAAFATLDPQHRGQLRAMPSEDAKSIWLCYASDPDALRAEVARVRSLFANRSTLGGTIAAHSIEAMHVDTYQFEREAATIVAKRQEQLLAHAYHRHLVSEGHDCGRARYGTGETTLWCDLFDETDGVLYEAKSGSDRESLRMAVGQLLDYRRCHPDPKPIIAVLLPHRPSDDLVAYLQSIPVRVVYREKDAWPVIG